METCLHFYGILKLKKILLFAPDSVFIKLNCTFAFLLCKNFSESFLFFLYF